MTQRANPNGRLMAELELITRDWRDGKLSDVTAVGKVLTTINQSPLPSPIEIKQAEERTQYKELLNQNQEAAFVRLWDVPEVDDDWLSGKPVTHIEEIGGSQVTVYPDHEKDMRNLLDKGSRHDH